MRAKSNTRPLRVFLCHSSADKPIVRDIYLKLQSEGWIDPWLDEQEILPGQDWDVEIRQAVDQSDAVIIFLSKGSVAKEGYLQKEIRSVFEEALEKPEQIIFILPLRIENCIIPNTLKHIQHIDYFPKPKRSWAYKRLLQSLKARAESLGLEIGRMRRKPQVYKTSSQLLKVGPKKSRKVNSDSKFQLRIVDPQKISRSLSTHGGHSIYTYGGLQFVQVPAGAFIMGSPFVNTFSHPDERPQLMITIPYDYFVGRYPVIVSEYLRFTEWTRREHEWDDDMDSKLDHPITCITWEAARDYCKWLNNQYADDLPIRSGVKLVFRLATEAEWEKAARGETGWDWPWGPEFDKDKCNSYEGRVLTTTPVGRYSAKGGDSPYGAADMAGNVWEWTNTVYSPYPYRSGDGRETKQGKGLKCVVRGGCYRDQQKYVRTCYRYSTPNSSLYYFQGFRVVIAPPVNTIR